MDPSELVYVIAADDDLPLSLQLIHADGTLQPRILPMSSLSDAGSHHHRVTVYDVHGNDMAEDVMIDEFEYVVDENGEVFRLINTVPNLLPSLNCLASVNSTESLTSEYTVEQNVKTSLKTHGDKMAAFSPGSSHTDLHSCWRSCQACDKTELSTELIEFSKSANGISISSCGNCEHDSPFPISSVAVTMTEKQNTEIVSVLCERNPLSICVNSSMSSNEFLTGNCSVPLSPESSYHGSPESVTKHDLATLGGTATSEVSDCLQNVEKYTTVVTDTTNTVVCHDTPESVNKVDLATNLDFVATREVSGCIENEEKYHSVVSDTTDIDVYNASSESVNKIHFSADLDYKATSEVLAGQRNVEQYSTVITDAINTEVCHGAPVSVSQVNLTTNLDCTASSEVSAGLQDVEQYTATVTDTTDTDVYHSSSESVSKVVLDCATSEVSPCLENVGKHADVVTDTTSSDLCHGTHESDGKVDLATSLDCIDSIEVSACLENIEQYSTVRTDSTSTDMHHDTSESASKVSLVTDPGCTTPGEVPRYEQNEEKCACVVTDATNADMTSVLCAGNGFPSSVAICDTVSNSTRSLCLSLAAIYCCNEVGGLCERFTDQSESNCVSASYVLPASNRCSVRSPASVLSSLTGDEHEANSALHVDLSQSNAPVTNDAANCNSDGSESQVADCLYKPDASCDTPEQSMSSCSPVTQLSSCGIEQHSAENATAVDISTSDELVSVAITTTQHESHVSDCRQFETGHNCADVLSADAEKAKQSVSETEKTSSYAVCDAPNDSNVDSLPPVCICDINAMDELVHQKGDIAVISPCDESGANVDCSSPVSSCDVNAIDEFVHQKSDVDVASSCDNVNGLDVKGGCDLSTELDTDHTVASNACLVSEPSNDTVGQIMPDEVQKFADIECHSQAECTTNDTYNGCQRDLLEATRSDCSNKVLELRRRLRALHKIRHRLRKLQQNKSSPPPLCASDTDLDALCEIDCKRLRLEAIEQELAGREMSLRRSEEQLDQRLLSVEQRELLVCIREQLLSRSSTQQEKIEILPGSPLQSVSKNPSVDRLSNVLKEDSKVTCKRTAQCRKPRLLLKKKGSHTIAASTRTNRQSKGVSSDISERKRTFRAAKVTKQKNS